MGYEARVVLVSPRTRNPTIKWPLRASLERTKEDWVHMALREQLLSRAEPRRGMCLPLSCSAGCDGIRVRVVGWLSGLVPRPTVSASPGNMQILGPYTRNLGGWGSALTRRLCDSLGEPELTKVREVTWPGGVGATGLPLLVEVGRHCRRPPPPWLWDWLEAPDHFWRG